MIMIDNSPNDYNYLKIHFYLILKFHQKIYLFSIIIMEIVNINPIF